ncbi:Gfo/Idh/MocA family oxidoreductase [Botryobacter ruber]|uniref:Gfo/Idh/MocA family oxidoreductase n=1 Tax=Botryobacter ruber TaxID=2171629 RepID=UPI000E0A393C|nr:Gfo/Idh/MocA family oxidoreductase [Botryobacter ruber]
MSRIINVGLIGFGMSGRVFQVPFLDSVPGFRLVKVRETREANINILRARYPDAQVVSQVEEIFGDEAVELVIVASATPTHYELTKAALLAGKHVVVEKPFTSTSAEADELIELAKKQQRLLTVYQNRRWDSDFLTVKKVLASGMLGNLVEYEAHFDRFRNTITPNTWKEENLPGTGVLYDLGVHLVDQALCLFGLPDEVTGMVRIQREGSKVIDNFKLLLHYPRLTVTLRSGMLVREVGPRYTLLGDQGSFLKYGLDVQEETLKAGIGPKDLPAWGVEPEEIWGRINTTHNGLHVIGKIESEHGDYRGLYENVYKALTGEAELEVKPEQARNAIRVLELALQSSQEKRTLKFG